MCFLSLPSSAPLNPEKMKVANYDRERERKAERGREGQGWKGKEGQREGCQGRRQEEGSIWLILCYCELARILSKFCPRTLLSEMRPGAGSTISPLLYSLHFQTLHTTFQLCPGLSLDLDPIQATPWLWLGASVQAGC